ncbi:hypothetical protein GPA07_06630 [Bacillus sp. ms-22]|nr:hypothetical protein GPA07_06630 [Bacillus sp. ms-22]
MKVKNNKKILYQVLHNEVNESINEYLKEGGQDNSVSKGQNFCEWVLFNVFELREDEVAEATEISGNFNSGIDAIFEMNNELCIMQSKYKNAHSPEAMKALLVDCNRIISDIPETERSIVLENCKKIRESYQNGENINCFYVTNNEISEWEDIQLKQTLKENRISNSQLKFEFWDINKIIEQISIKNGELPKNFRDKTFKMNIEKSFDAYDTTLVAMVKLKDFANFVIKGGNTLFHSNIRNYLKGTKINKGIKSTLSEQIDKFWLYNNGVTIVCDTYEDRTNIISLKSPQIVNGCQTAKTIGEFYNKLTSSELSDIDKEGHVLVKVIRTRKSATNEEKKELRDNITRYTNSQNAVKGLDFYALDRFQRDLQRRLEKSFGFYYEIQRGAFITLDVNKKNSFMGYSDYNYLLEGVNSKKKYVLPAKEVIQSFTAAIKQMPNVAYGRANELTPTGDRWKDIVNDETEKMPIEHFLYPYLILKYVKEKLKYRGGVKDFRKNSAFLFIATYYKLILKLINKFQEADYEKPEEIPIEYYRGIFQNSELNKMLLNHTHDILKYYFKDSAVKKSVADNLRGFLMNRVTQAEYWHILNEYIDDSINENEEEIYHDMRDLLIVLDK